MFFSLHWKSVSCSLRLGFHWILISNIDEVGRRYQPAKQPLSYYIKIAHAIAILLLRFFHVSPIYFM